MLQVALRPRWTLPLSAASGLVLSDGIAYVLGDDRSALDRLVLVDGSPLPSLALLAEGTPATLSKPEKPDLEALLALDGGDLLALGSGSRPNRERGFLVDANGRAHAMDLGPLYERLRVDIPDLNIEGAVLTGDVLLMAHRGVGQQAASRLIRLDAKRLFVDSQLRWPASALIDIQVVSLGSLDDVALGFTDLALDDQGALHYLAAAEATDQAYLDGECLGSVIGRIDADGRAQTLARLHPKVKAEGLAFVSASADTTQWLVVTDADDPARQAMLYALDLPR